MAKIQTKCTLADIAEHAKVSVPTVSRVINKFPRIADDTRRRVQSSIKKLGYSVSLGNGQRARISKARNAGQNTCGKVMFLVPDVHMEAGKTALTEQLFAGITSVMIPAGVELVLDYLKEPDLLPDGFYSGGIDGVICKNWPKSQAVIEAIKKVPHVWCLSSPFCTDLGDQVFMDSDFAAHYAAEFFEKRGFRKVVLFTTLAELSENSRAVALRKHLGERGMTLEVHESNPTAIESACIKPGTGVFVDSADFYLTPVYLKILKMHLKLHEEVEILSVCISKERLDSFDPSLSRLDFNFAALGKAAAELLLWRKANPNEPARRIMLIPGTDFR